MLDREHVGDQSPQAISFDRLWDSLGAAAEIGRWRSCGVQRLALTDADRRMRDTFCAWCRDAGLHVRVDRIGNIFARRQGAAELAPVMIGSHLDSQVAGGRFDGALGVLAGLEILRSLDDRGIETRRPVEVVSWSNEEGARFSPPMLGASVFTGALPLERALAAPDGDGATFGTELARIGYAGAAPVPGAPPAAYFELHIEQDDVLHRRGLELGIVTGAFTAHAAVLRLRGATAHSGATPMRRRRDAVAGAAEICCGLDRLTGAHGSDARATTTRLTVWPNRPGIVAGEAVLSIDYRHPTTAGAEAMRRDVDELVRDACDRHGLECERLGDWSFGDRVTFDPELANLVRRNARLLGVQTTDMTSSAGHDAYLLAGVSPTAILFTPCVDGITHNEHEDVDPERIAPAVDVLARAVVDAADGEVRGD
ncbi:MAG TPA: hydantoinase/carbamoylase family amidase [Solirubrobacteraceae bacterium]|nr:hydantoinase/carbamoylase family amidase [Solirubrobacteraceae bacterium]